MAPPLFLSQAHKAPETTLRERKTTVFSYRIKATINNAVKLTITSNQLVLEVIKSQREAERAEHAKNTLNYDNMWSGLQSDSPEHTVLTYDTYKMYFLSSQTLVAAFYTRWQAPVTRQTRIRMD